MPRRGAASVPGRRARVRRASIPALVVIAVAIAATTMIGMSARAVIDRTSCSRHPIVVNLAASTDIAPTIQAIARTFNTQSQVVDGRCVEVEVTPLDSSAVAGEVDGQTPLQGQTPVDAWIPDSSLWIDVAQSYATGAEMISSPGFSVAKSPIMLVTTKAVASETGIFGQPASWNLLLPSSYGGPPGGLGLSVDIPDPADSAVGLTTLIQVSRALGTSAAGRAGFAKFEYNTTATADFDPPGALAGLVTSTEGPLGHRAIAEASEQAVIGYDRQHPSDPLAARYPTSGEKALDAAELDYPYVVTTTSSDYRQAAAVFGHFLLGSYAQSLIRYAGFRSAAGVPDVEPPSYGLSSQPLTIATPPSAAETDSSISAWKRLGLGSKILILRDISFAMNTPVSKGGPSIEDVLSGTAVVGLGLFPDGTQMGLWEMPSQTTSASYKVLVPTGALPGDVGLMTRRQELEELNETLKAGDKPLLLYDAIVAGYKSMTDTYSTQYSNALVVLTAAIDSPQDMSFQAAMAEIKHLYKPSRQISIVVLDFGGADIRQLSELAAATGGQAFPVTSPIQVGRIFAEAIGNRLCNSGCSAP
jgi:Ca-activated chloride channel homolog